jgi:hypothetical protein
MAATPGTVSPTNDDALTVCAISLLSGMLAAVLHEGLGHAALALITGTQSGLLTTVAWSSAFEAVTATQHTHGAICRPRRIHLEPMPVVASWR